MSNVEILEKAFKEYNCENIIATDGKLYAAILSAMSNMNLETKSKFKASINAALADISPSEELNQTVAVNESFEKVKRVSKLVKSEIDYGKRGAVAESLLRFIEECDGATFTEINMFYKNINPEDYNSKTDRGGSLVHWLKDLRESKMRMYSKRYVSIYNSNGKWYVD